jgi:hypothetical protein
MRERSNYHIKSIHETIDADREAKGWRLSCQRSKSEDAKRSCSFILWSFFSESLNAEAVRRTQV